MMKKAPTISIIIPNHNYAYFLPHAIRSVIAQTFSDWECIIIDDASDDNSVTVIKKLIARDKRFKLIQTDTRIGIAAARNRGLDMARGEYIAFLDSDDCYTQNALEILLQLIRQTNANMAGGRALMVDSEFKFIETENTTFSLVNFSTTSTPTEYINVGMAFRWVWVWRRLYKRSFINSIRFREQFTDMGEDICFMLDLCTQDCLLAECANPIVFHRKHSASVTSSDFLSIKKFDWFPDMFKIIRDEYRTKYSDGFLRMLYNQQFFYMIREALIAPKRLNKLQIEGKRAIIESCKLIPRKYLRPKFRILCWFLSCLK